MNDEMIDVEKMDHKIARNSTILKLANDGVSYTDIGKQFNLTKARVSQIAIDAGYKKRTKAVKDINLTDEVIVS